MSRAEAAAIIGCAPTTVDALIERGELPVARPGIRSRRSLARNDVEAAATRWREQQQRREAQRLVREASRTLPTGEWIDAHTVARLLGCTPTWVRRLAKRDRIPHLRRGGRYFFRSDLVEVYANAWFGWPSE